MLCIANTHLYDNKRTLKGHYKNILKRYSYNKMILFSIRYNICIIIYYYKCRFLISTGI